MRRSVAAFTAADGSAEDREHDAEEERALAVIQRVGNVSRTFHAAKPESREAGGRRIPVNAASKSPHRWSACTQSG